MNPINNNNLPAIPALNLVPAQPLIPLHQHLAHQVLAILHGVNAPQLVDHSDSDSDSDQDPPALLDQEQFVHFTPPASAPATPVSGPVTPVAPATPTEAPAAALLTPAAVRAKRKEPFQPNGANNHFKRRDQDSDTI